MRRCTPTCTHTWAIQGTPKTRFRNIYVQSAFGPRTYQAALREGFFRKSCRRRWNLIPLPERHGVLTDHKSPGRLGGWRRAHDREAKKKRRGRKTSRTSMRMMKSKQRGREKRRYRSRNRKHCPGNASVLKKTFKIICI